ncbi:transposase [Chryseobacterium sp. CT-SW4]|uniref:transposase n=1 Tax=Chryseobacterium sp. SW-1 TaxID=3157343 RepID=UPI003B02CF2B
MKNLESFDYGGVYHVYSHANAQDLIFKETSNYQYFLEKLSRYIIPVADIYAYSLLPNHFHLLLRFKDRQIEENEKENIHKNLMKPFSNMLNGYAKAYNKRYNRKGALFLDFIKRKKVEDEKYLLKLVHYIHHNPVNHGFVRELNDWNYSSYRSYLDLYKKSQIKREDIMEYFDSIQDFIAFHHSSVEYDFLEM